MPRASKKPVIYYPFLDVVMDVFYSIILYNAFISFPGWNIQFFLLLFVIFVMLNYWWAARTFHELPKHYVFDYYMLTAVMFIFSLMTDSLGSLTNFFLLASLFFLVDALYSLFAIYVHAEKEGSQQLRFYFIAEGLLAGIYLLAASFIHTLDIFALAVLFIPYLIYFGIHIRRGYFKLVFVDNGRQPY